MNRDERYHWFLLMTAALIGCVIIFAACDTDDKPRTITEIKTDTLPPKVDTIVRVDTVPVAAPDTDDGRHDR